MKPTLSQFHTQVKAHVHATLQRDFVRFRAKAKLDALAILRDVDGGTWWIRTQYVLDSPFLLPTSRKDVHDLRYAQLREVLRLSRAARRW